jgi:hypothetical protein
MHRTNAQTTQFQRTSLASHTEIPTSERYENDFGMRAQIKKIAKEKKETKKSLYQE